MGVRAGTTQTGSSRVWRMVDDYHGLVHTDGLIERQLVLHCLQSSITRRIG